MPLIRDSTPLGWRGVRACAYAERAETEGCATHAGDDMLLVLVTQGTFQVEYQHDGQWRSFVARPGDLNLVSPGSSLNARYRRVLGDPPCTLHIRLGMPLFKRAADALSLPAPEAVLPSGLAVRSDPYVRASAWALHDALHGGAPAVHAEAVARGLASYLLLARQRLRGRRRTSATTTIALSAARTARVHAYMVDRISADITLDDLAAVAHASRFHFARSFKAATGVSPLRYLTDLRMAHAEDLLRNTSLPVSAVGRRVGYGTASSFGSAFRRHRGRAPSDLRNRGSELSEGSTAA